MQDKKLMNLTIWFPFEFRGRFIPREVPVIHPIVHVNRHHIVDVPRHSFRHFRRDEFIEHGFPTRRSW